MSAREVFERFIDLSAKSAYDELADLFAEDAVIEMPFAPPGFPTTSQGREVFRARFASVRDLWTTERIDPVIVYDTTDPDVIIAEVTLHQRLIKTGTAFSASYIMIMTIRNGEIVHSRDYSNPLASAKALGRLDDLVAAYSAE